MTETSSKTAIVTGARSGIGAALVRRLTADGLKVFSAARCEDKLKALADETGATPVVVDITYDDVARLRDTVLAEGRVDAAKAEQVYAGVDEPLTAEDEVMAFALNLPHHINLDQVIMRPVAQAAQHKVIRKG